MVARLVTLMARDHKPQDIWTNPKECSLALKVPV